jgi:hypothetical protein
VSTLSPPQVDALRAVRTAYPNARIALIGATALGLHIQSGLSKMDTLGDERQFDTTELEAKVTAPESNKNYNEWLQRTWGETVWNAGCSSWYKHDGGKITNNWSSFVTQSWWLTREPDLAAFDCAAG